MITRAELVHLADMPVHTFTNLGHRGLLPVGDADFGNPRLAQAIEQDEPAGHRTYRVVDAFRLALMIHMSREGGLPWADAKIATSGIGPLADDNGRWLMIEATADIWHAYGRYVAGQDDDGEPVFGGAQMSGTLDEIAAQVREHDRREDRYQTGERYFRIAMVNASEVFRTIINRAAASDIDGLHERVLAGFGMLEDQAPDAA